MNYFAKTISFLALAFPILLLSCTEEEIQDDYLLEEYYLLESSANILPYSKHQSVVFSDSAGNKVQFQIKDSGKTPAHTSKSWEVTNKISGETKVYHIKGENRTYNLINDSLDLKFRIEIDTYINATDIPSHQVQDRILISTQKISGEYYDIFSDIINPRNFKTPYERQKSPFDKIEINGRSFSNFYEAEKNYIRSSFLKFNYEVGIISFVDKTDNLWVFDNWPENSRSFTEKVW